MNNRPLMTFVPFLLLASIALTLSSCGGGGGASQRVIANQQLLSQLQNGTTAGSFTGIGSCIDTKVPFAGAPVLPSAPALDPTVAALILTNFNSYLDTTHTPQFSSGSGGPFAGVTVDSSLKKITLTSGATTVSWLFEANKVTRSYSNGSDTSTYVYGFANGQTSVTFDETVSRANLAATYKGSATFVIDPSTGAVNRLTGASFTQDRCETTAGGKINNVKGTVTMRAEDAVPDNLSFSGTYSVYLPSYGQANGTVSTDKMTYLRGFSQTEGTYYNSNLADSTAIVFTSL